MARGKEACVRLSVVLSGDEAPSEFRIFTAGKVETTKGTFLFDAKAAESVMAAYREHGIDLMIDYDHASLGSAADPALAGRAAGWFVPEVRAGELWATDVRWAPPAAVALKNKEWRFMSPAFELGDDDRITRLLNVALTNLPATRRLEPLMAANDKGKTVMANDSGLSSKLVNQALEAVASKDAKAALDLMKQILAALLGGAPDESAPADGGGDAPPMDPASAAASLTAASLIAKEFVSAGRLALSLTGMKDIGPAMAELRRTHKLAKDLETRETQLKADRELVDAAEYVSLTAKLVKAGQVSPFLAWVDGQEGKIPSIMMKGTPLADLRTRVEKLGDAKPTTPAPPKVGGPSTAYDLTEAELKICAEMKCEPAVYAQLKMQRDSAKTAKAGV